MTDSLQDVVAITPNELNDGDRVRLYPNFFNPIHKRPVDAMYSGGYFYCDDYDPMNGPDYYFGDVLRYNDKIELLSPGRSGEKTK